VYPGAAVPRVPVVAAALVAPVVVLAVVLAVVLLLLPLAPDQVLDWGRRLPVRVSVWWQAALRGRPDGGQASAEYALVLLGAAGVALLLTRWATSGDNDKVKRLLDSVFEHLLGHTNNG